MTVAQLVIKELKRHGIEYLFGIPGGPSLSYMEACRKEGIQFVLVKNEASAGFMATAYAMITGKIAACHGTFGPGATNLSTGVGCAYLDRVPLLALTTEMSDANRHRTVQMNIDHQKIYEPITKWTTRLNTHSVKRTISKAIEIAYSEVPGPVHIGLPADITDKEVVEEVDVPEIKICKAPKIGSAMLKALREQFLTAKRPLLAVGLSANRYENIDKEIVKLAEKFDVPVVLTPMAKGMIKENHKNYLGVVFHALSTRLDPIIKEADLVVGIGYDPIEFNYEDWIPKTPLIHIDSVVGDVPKDVDVLQIIGSVSDALDYLNKSEGAKKEWDYSKIEMVKKEIGVALRPKSERLTSSEVLDALRKTLPENGVMTCDVGAHTHLIGQLWETPAPKRQIMTNGWSSMGFGVPSAIGAKFAVGENVPVVCVSGDGGFLMNFGELMTARRLNLTVVFLVLNDNDLSLIDVKQQWKNYQKYEVDLYEGSMFGTDIFLGLPVYRVTKSEDLDETMRKAFAHKGPSVIEAQVDSTVYSKLIARR